MRCQRNPSKAKVPIHTSQINFGRRLVCTKPAGAATACLWARNIGRDSAGPSQCWAGCGFVKSYVEKLLLMKVNRNPLSVLSFAGRDGGRGMDGMAGACSCTYCTSSVQRQRCVLGERERERACDGLQALACTCVDWLAHDINGSTKQCVGGGGACWAGRETGSLLAL